MSKSDYIDCIDSNDIAHNWRHKKEADYFDSRHELDTVSGGCQIIDENGATGLMSFRDKELSHIGV